MGSEHANIGDPLVCWSDAGQSLVLIITQTLVTFIAYHAYWTVCQLTIGQESLIICTSCIILGFSGIVTIG